MFHPKETSPNGHRLLRSRNQQARLRYLAVPPLLLLLLSCPVSPATATTAPPRPASAQLSPEAHVPAAPLESATLPAVPVEPRKGVLRETLPEFLGSLASGLVLALMGYVLKRILGRRRTRRSQDHVRDDLAS